MIIQKQTYNDHDIVTLPRKTRGGVPNANGYTYSKEAFEDAMDFYVTHKHGMVYAAPVSLEVGPNISYEKMISVNNKVYASFFKDNNEKYPSSYTIGKVIGWDDFTITIQLIGTLLTKQFIKYIKEDTEIKLRYIPLSEFSKTKIITKMSISMLDMSIIPFEDLGIDINKLLEDKKYEDIW